MVFDLRKPTLKVGFFVVCCRTQQIVWRIMGYMVEKGMIALNGIVQVLSFIFLLFILRYPILWYLGIGSLQREQEITREQLELIQRQLAHLQGQAEDKKR
jgi:hypothetical protein